MKISLIAPLILLLVGCSGSGGGSLQENGVGGREDAMVSPNFSVQMAHLILPDGVNFKFPFELKNEQIYAKANGELRRGITLEALEGDTNLTMDSVSASFKSAGFKPKRKPIVGPKGDVVLIFGKKNNKDIYVKAYPASIMKPENHAVLTTLWISWQVLPAPAKINAGAING